MIRTPAICTFGPSLVPLRDRLRRRRFLDALGVPGEIFGRADRVRQVSYSEPMPNRHRASAYTTSVNAAPGLSPPTALSAAV